MSLLTELIKTTFCNFQMCGYDESSRERSVADCSCDPQYRHSSSDLSDHWLTAYSSAECLPQPVRLIFASHCRVLSMHRSGPGPRPSRETNFGPKLTAANVGSCVTTTGNSSWHD